ncbi:MAG TPA: GTPase HflX, partial [Kiloniellaceae bacterium]|nr:GTPase HflX [Kiloniellaceae bacterium]
GYTNAGKSTLFNHLTEAKVLARDQLFATLDPTMRRVVLPSGQTVILSDTVGFISDLPTDLIAAFRATLEEVLEADLILHVRDIAHPDSRAQEADVKAVLTDLGVAEDATNVLEVLNKVDLLQPQDRARFALRDAGQPQAVLCSALTGEGCDQVLEMIDAALSARRVERRLRLPLSEGAALSWLYDHAEVLAREDDGLIARLTVKIGQPDLQRYLKLFPELAEKQPESAEGPGVTGSLAGNQLQSG